MEELKLIKRGAESQIYETYFLGIHAIVKNRISKAYRDPKLDREINSERTIMEAKLMYTALKSGINVPAILYIDKENFSIIMEFIEGNTVKEVLWKNLYDTRKIGEMIGEIALKLHKAQIAHGDLTTNNLILKGEDLFLIDFGLSKRTNDIEDFATDVHVFLRSLESAHPDKKDEVFEGFKYTYSKFDLYGKVMETMRDIRMRGRYIEERRSKSSDRE
ncbi:Kae1-associated kinase Bud32 [Acidianus sp. HS-5]|uniref:Kae1-associated kinase Bud32 n=1 Tax=Acidianus sp. HS-5 TaxID=2886040 RepID=UPI001F435F2A|nr:Kae1-associated kinase Bud32 [Acidianus sp. HS-5]BDC19180.1 Kae1-associated kinase Bud32 [Acidianus sp. HS-5]